MTKDDLIQDRRRAINLLEAYESGNMMSLVQDAEDLTNEHTEIQILALRNQIAELERRIESHPDHTSGT
jgi:polyhydroxyalkanoate synthesis regulator phasin